MWTLFSWNLENLPPLLPSKLPEIVAGWGNPEVVCLQETRVRPREVSACGGVGLAGLAHPAAHEPLEVLVARHGP